MRGILKYKNMVINLEGVSYVEESKTGLTFWFLVRHQFVVVHGYTWDMVKLYVEKCAEKYDYVTNPFAYIELPVIGEKVQGACKNVAEN